MSLWNKLYVYKFIMPTLYFRLSYIILSALAYINLLSGHGMMDGESSGNVNEELSCIK